MTKLTTIVPDVWRIRIDRLLDHLEAKDCELFVTQVAKYRAVPKEQCTYFTDELLEELYDKLFEAEIYAGVNLIDYTKQMLEELKTKLFAGYRYKVGFMRALDTYDAKSIELVLGDLAQLPPLVRQEISANLNKLL